MAKKGIAAVLFLVLMSTLWAWGATSWQLQTKLSNAGGSIKVRNNPLQTAVGAVVYANFTTAAAIPVTVAANAGYRISGLTRSGSALPIGNYTSHYSTTFQKSAGSSQTLLATFAIRQFMVTATATGPGSITPASVSLPYGGTAVFTATPSQAGSFLAGVNGGSVADLAGNPVTLPFGGPVKITAANVTAPRTVTATFLAYSVDAGSSQVAQLNSLVTLKGSMVGDGTPAWSQVSGPAVALGGAATLNPSFVPSSTGTYLFQLLEQLGGKVMAQATTQVTVVESVADSMRVGCMGCHAATGVSPAAYVFQRWSASRHSALGVTCVTCHTDAAMPTPLNENSVERASFKITQASAGPVGGYFCSNCHTAQNAVAFAGSRHSANGLLCTSCHTGGSHNPAAGVSACNGCHLDATGEVVNHPFAVGSAACTGCHDVHTLQVSQGSMGGALGALHFNNQTGAGYPASYVTSRSSCSDCHYDSPANREVRHQWYTSGHARVNGRAWSLYDFKTRSGCVQCHTSTGFVAYSSGRQTAAWGSASDKTKELLTCVGCHKDMRTGELRTPRPVQPYPDDSYLNRDAGKSNICLGCHSGRNNGASITARLAAGADFGNLAFIDSHYMAAGGVLNGKVGYHFGAASRYAGYSANTHRRIGVAGSNGTGTSGPCIACHKTAASGHRFSATAGELCANCHGSYLSTELLTQKKQSFESGLTALEAMLAAKGHPYSPDYPYFAQTNWGSGQAGADTMGAAFNYLLLVKEPGAFAHNSDYAKQLIADSIDYLYNGTVTGSLDPALTFLVGENRITQQTADSVAAYRAQTSCTSCHNQTSGSHPAHLASGFGCADCHSLTVASGTTLEPGGGHLDGTVEVLGRASRPFSFQAASSGGSCSSISCHNNGSATWGGTLGCDGCHDAPPATASHLKHFGGTAAQAAYGSTAIAQDFSANAGAYLMNCGNCHPMDGSKHGNGVVDVELYNPQAPAGSLKALNPASAAYNQGFVAYVDSRGLAYTRGNCSNVYCHSYNDWTTTASIGVNDPNWESKVVATRKYRTVMWGGAALTCSGCHGNPTQTSYPTNDGGAGDSHSWIDSYGYQSLHTYNMESDPVSCKTCHFDTVKQVNSFTSNNLDVRTLGDVPIANFSKHVNGRNDVAFDRQNSISYFGNTPLSLANANYDAATRTCSNVACHVSQTTVKWGKPYRWDTDECDNCHGYMY